MAQCCIFSLFYSLPREPKKLDARAPTGKSARDPEERRHTFGQNAELGLCHGHTIDPLDAIEEGDLMPLTW